MTVFFLLAASCTESRGKGNNSHHTPPHTSHHYRNAGQISDTAGKCGLCVSLSCEEQLTDLQEVQLHFETIAPSLYDWKASNA